MSEDTPLTPGRYGHASRLDPAPAESPDGARTDRSAILADSDHARRLAIEALTNHRLEMGLGFARLALTAARAARAMPTQETHTDPGRLVPVIGQTRDEQPHRDGTPAGPLGPTGDGGVDLERAAAPTFDDVATQHFPFPLQRSSRCTWDGQQNVSAPGVAPLGRDVCWGAVFYDPAANLWRHLNLSLDEHHNPRPREEDIR